MSTDRDVARIVRSWLEDGADALPDRVLDSVLDQLPATPQRRSWWPPRRIADMNTFAKLAIAAAAVVVVAVGGINFLPARGGAGGGPAVSPSPSPSPSLSPGLPLGPRVLTVAGDSFDVSMTVTIAAADWDGSAGGGILVKSDSADPPDGAGLIVFTGQLEVYGDPCNWATTRPDPMTAPTVDAVIAALAAQAGRNATEPVDITVDGYTGKSIELSVPTDANFADCDSGQFRSWGPGANRYHQGPGQIDQVWVVDVDGTLVTIDAAWYEGTPADVRAELDAILDSFRFE